MISKIKPTAFIKESYCVRVMTKGDALFLVRTDRITIIAMRLDMELPEDTAKIDCVVDYNQFASLSKHIDIIRQEPSYLYIKIKNGGEYKLSFVDVKDYPDIPTHTGEVTQKRLNFTDVSKSTLKSHLTNDQRHIYSVPSGIYATNFLTAAKCKPAGDELMLYPADVLASIVGTYSLSKDESTVTVSNEEFILQTARPHLEDKENFEMIVALFDEPIEWVPAGDLHEQINRIAMFDESLKFKGNEIISVCGKEPSPLITEEEIEFDTAPLVPYMVDVKEVGFTLAGNLKIKNIRDVEYLVSRRTYEG